MGHNRGGRNIKPIMLSCFLNDAASGCLHWPKCANNFYDYDCDYHAASSIQASKHPCIQTSSMGNKVQPVLALVFEFACIFIAAAPKMERCMCLHSRAASTSMIGWPPVIWARLSTGQLSFPTRPSAPHPNHNNRAQISQYLSAKMLKQRLIILCFVFVAPFWRRRGAFPRCWP